MLTSLFRKSTPLNYSLLFLGALGTFVGYQMHHGNGDGSINSIGIKAGLLAIVLASFFVANFIVKKNGLSRDSSYTILFFLLLLMFFPAVLDRPNLLLSNFFILLALRRLISLHSLKAAKEKVFDASMWIFVAALFHFWSIVFIVLVFISILFHVSRDYRNWLLPFIALFAVATAFGLFSVMFDETLIGEFLAKIHSDFSIDYFKHQNENVALSFYAVIALFFVFSMIFTISSRPLVLQSSYKKIVASFFIGLFIYLVSPGKSNEFLIFTFAPLASMATSQIELPQSQMKQEIILGVFILSAMFLYIMQL